MSLKEKIKQGMRTIGACSLAGIAIAGTSVILTLGLPSAFNAGLEAIEQREKREKMSDQLRQLKKSLGNPGAADRAAEIILRTPQ